MNSKVHELSSPKDIRGNRKGTLSHMPCPNFEDPANIRSIQAVDLFCGAGGLTRGLLDAGLEVVAGYDLDSRCKYPYEQNNKPSAFNKVSVCDITAEQIESHFSKDAWKVIVGCAPCQPFSTYARGKGTPEDHRWSLLAEFSRLVKQVKPHVISMENVPGLQKQAIYAEFVKQIEKEGYNLSSAIVFCPDYGIPQIRKRLVLLASRLGNIELKPPTHERKDYSTVRSTISDLSPLRNGQKDELDSLHLASRLDPLNLKRIQASVPGGSWKDWPEDLVADCHLEEEGATYVSVYGRMKWDEPSPTITTQFFGFGNGRFGHPEQDRALSLREGALLQTFPPTYEFVDPGSPTHIKHIGRMIGNAVPVRLGEIVGQSIEEHLRNHEQ